VTSSPDHVAIIGGGASGVLAAIHILRGAPEPVRVTVIEPRAQLGRGVAYGTRDLDHLLNTRAGCMSAFPEDPGHFTAWAKRFTITDGADFLPRAWYGEYLGSLLAPVDHVRGEAVDIAPSGSRVAVTLASGSTVNYDRVILAPGPSPQRWPAALGGSGRRWIGDPWAPSALGHIRPYESVLLVETGLTAMDVALALGTAGHPRLIATSRHGLMPLAHPVDPFPPLTLVPPVELTARSLFGWARDIAAEVGDWRQVVDALRPHTNALWSALPEVERRRLLDHHQRRWEVVRHRMAPSVAARISAMQEDGCLSVVPGASARCGRPAVASGSSWPIADFGSGRWSTAAGPRPIFVGRAINWSDVSSATGWCSPAPSVWAWPPTRTGASPAPIGDCGWSGPSLGDDRRPWHTGAGCRPSPGDVAGSSRRGLRGTPTRSTGEQARTAGQ
jgi:uncharacterized NAD(P)/FAD-binding protein YdhS